MTTKGHELESAILKALGQIFLLLKDASLDGEAIDAILTGPKRRRSRIFENPIAVQITTRRGDFEKMRDFQEKARARSFCKLLYLEILTDRFNEDLSEMLTAAIFNAVFDSTAPECLILRFEDGKYTPFDLCEVVCSYEAWLNKKDGGTFLGLLAFWKSEEKTKGGQKETESQEEKTASIITAKKGYCLIERQVTPVPKKTGSRACDGFVRYYISMGDLDSEIRSLLQKPGEDIKTSEIFVVFEEVGLTSGHTMKTAKNVFLRATDDFTATEEFQDERPPRPLPLPRSKKGSGHGSLLRTLFSGKS